MTMSISPWRIGTYLSPTLLASGEPVWDRKDCRKNSLADNLDLREQYHSCCNVPSRSLNQASASLVVICRRRSEMAWSRAYLVRALVERNSAVESRHRCGYTAFVQVNQPFRRDSADKLEELLAPLAVCFRVPLDGVERLFSGASPVVPPTAGPSTSSSAPRFRAPDVRVTRSLSDRDAFQPGPNPTLTPVANYLQMFCIVCGG